MQRVSPIVRRFRARLAAASGAIDLATIMVGVIVIGVITSIAIATVFAIIPWSQDKAAQESLHAVKDAQSVAFAKYNSYFDGNGLVAKGLLPQKVAVTAEGTIDGGRGAAVIPHLLETRSPKGIPGITVNADGSCYVSAVLSPTGAVYYNTALNPTMIRVVPGVDAQPDTSNCAPFPDVADWPLPLVITTTSVPAAVVGKAYSAQIAWTGTATPTFAVTTGATPSWINLSSSGLLSGTPTNQSVTRTFTVTATSSNGTATATYTLTVGTAPTLPATTTLPPATAGVAYSTTITATGDSSTYTVASGSLPTGLSLSNGGVISGTPTAAGTSTFTVTATNSSGSTQTVVTVSVARPFAVVGSTIAEAKDAAFAIDAAGNGTAWGWPTYGNSLDVAASEQTPTLMVGGYKFASISAGDNFELALDSSGHLYSWGTNSAYQRGSANPTSLVVPSAPIFQQVSAGSDYGLAIDASGNLWGWGDNSNYQAAGAATSGFVQTPTKIAPLQNQTFNWVAAGQASSAAIDSNGHLWTWGGSTPQEIVPAQTFVKVFSANGSMAAIDTSGHLWVWGLNAQGQLGVGSTTTVTTPTEVYPTATFSTAAFGGFAYPTFFAVDTSGNLYFSGKTSSLGVGLTGVITLTKITSPSTIVGTISEVAQSAAGYGNVVVKTTSGKYYSWGYNSSPEFYMVGDNSSTNRWTPTQITVP